MNRTTLSKPLRAWAMAWAAGAFLLAACTPSPSSSAGQAPVAQTAPTDVVAAPVVNLDATVPPAQVVVQHPTKAVQTDLVKADASELKRQLDSAGKALIYGIYFDTGKAAADADGNVELGKSLLRYGQHEQALLRYYHDCLKAEGITSYSFEDLYQHYRWFSFSGISVAFGAAMLVKQTERGDEMFLTMLRRHTAQVRDNNSLELLKTLA